MHNFYIGKSVCVSPFIPYCMYPFMNGKQKLLEDVETNCVVQLSKNLYKVSNLRNKKALINQLILMLN